VRGLATFDKDMNFSDPESAAKFLRDPIRKLKTNKENDDVQSISDNIEHYVQALWEAMASVPENTTPLQRQMIATFNNRLQDFNGHEPTRRMVAIANAIVTQLIELHSNGGPSLQTWPTASSHSWRRTKCRHPYASSSSRPS
jgi:hypothetical protein